MIHPILYAILLILLLGLILIRIGMRGRRIPIEPRCAKCDYIVAYLKDAPDPRCPECGSDLSLPNSVRFGRVQRRFAWVIAGLLLIAFSLVLPMTNIVASARLWSAAPGQPLRDARTPFRTLMKDLARRPDDFWIWQELERRQRNGLLTNQELSDVLKFTIPHCVEGREQYTILVPMRQFIAGALADDCLTAAQHSQLAQAFYGRDPVVKLPSRCRPGDAVEFEIDHQSFIFLPGAKPLTALRKVVGNGTTIALCPGLDETGSLDKNQLSIGGSGTFGARLLMDLPVGRHTLTFYLDRGTTAHRGAFESGNLSTPGQAEIWPSTLAKWECTVSVPIEVVPPDATTTDEVTDVALRPIPGKAIVVQVEIFAMDEKQSLAQVNMICRDLKVPLCGDVLTNIDGRCVRLGSIRAEGSNTRERLTVTIPKLAPDVRKFDITIQPAPRRAEQQTLFKRIWGLPIVLNEVPLSRRDLKGVETQPDQP